ncbi:unnamed protein product [Adineta ricciae]|uniref:Uncharacterized protein n=1 Tax=Adineta ricciae TaxID=249248 RepID=A0A814UHS6_ADIRI|nr:unnamed protein product [Adineta ricciae]
MGCAPSQKERKNTTQQHRTEEQAVPQQSTANSIRSTVTATNTLQQSSKISIDPQDRRISQNLQQKSATPRTSPPAATSTTEIFRPLPNNDMSRKSQKPPTPPSPSDSDSSDSSDESELPTHKTRESERYTPLAPSVSPSKKQTRQSGTPKRDQVRKSTSSSKNPVRKMTSPPMVRTPIKFPEITGRCSFCPHCQSSTYTAIPNARHVGQEPSWFVKDVSSDGHICIDMDKYDQDAVHNQLISTHGRIPGSYDYRPNLTIYERKHKEESLKNYCTLPAILKYGSTKSPTSTPFPNSDYLESHDRRLNKPYTTQLFID